MLLNVIVSTSVFMTSAFFETVLGVAKGGGIDNEGLNPGRKGCLLGTPEGQEEPLTMSWRLGNDSIR